MLKSKRFKGSCLVNSEEKVMAVNYQNVPLIEVLSYIEVRYFRTHSGSGNYPVHNSLYNIINKEIKLPVRTYQYFVSYLTQLC